MIEAVKIYELYVATGLHSDLSRKYGSKRSGTIYIAASNPAEAEEVAKQLFSSNGFAIPTRMWVNETHLVKQVLRMIY